jgi:hypothetical protein
MAVFWLLALVGAPAAAAPPDQATLQAYRDGVAQLVALIDARESGWDASSPAATELNTLLSTTFSEARMLGFSDADLANPTALLDVCQGANKAMTALAMAGARAQIDPAADQASTTAKLVALADSNSIRFQDQYARVMPFMTHCLALQSTATIGLLGRPGQDPPTPARRAGLAQMRNGMLAFIAGATVVAADARYRADNRSVILDSLEAHIGTLLRVLPMDMRAPIRDAAAAAGAHAEPAFAPRFATLSSALDSEPCQLLCNVIQLAHGAARTPACLTQPITLAGRSASARLCAVGGDFVHHDYYVEIDGKRAVGGIDDDVARGVEARVDGSTLQLQCVPEHRASAAPVDDGLVKAMMAKAPDASEAQVRHLLEQLNTVEVARTCTLRVDDAPALSVRVEQPQ